MNVVTPSDLISCQNYEYSKKMDKDCNHKNTQHT